MSHDALSVGDLAHAHGRFGRPDRAEQLIAELLASRSGGHVAPKAMIVACAGIGENDHASYRSPRVSLNNVSATSSDRVRVCAKEVVTGARV
jgi:hypothetical protein